MSTPRKYRPRPAFGISSRGLWASIAVPFLGGRYSRGFRVRRKRVPGGQA